MNRAIVDYRTYLRDVLDARRRRNPQYSLRALAQAVGISAAQLSKVLNRRQPLSPKHALRIAEKLCLSPREREQLLEALAKEHAGQTRMSLDWHALAEDEFRLVSDWHHLAILSLGGVRGNRADPRWIAARLNLPVGVAREAFERLARLGLLETVGEGFRQTTAPLTTTTDVSSAAIRKYHQQTLELAARKLENVPVELREYTTITVSANPEKLSEVKSAMREFKRKMAEILQEGEHTEVYTLALQLFPVTQSQRKDGEA